MFSVFLYCLWFAAPIVFLLLALYAKLEQLSKTPTKQNPVDFLRSGIFVLFCALVALAIDQYWLQDLYESLSPKWIDFRFYQIMLLPLLLAIMAKVIGATKPATLKKEKQNPYRRRTRP